MLDVIWLRARVQLSCSIAFILKNLCIAKRLKFISNYDLRHKNLFAQEPNQSPITQEAQNLKLSSNAQKIVPAKSLNLTSPLLDWSYVYTIIIGYYYWPNNKILRLLLYTYGPHYYSNGMYLLNPCNHILAPFIKNIPWIHYGIVREYSNRQSTKHILIQINKCPFRFTSISLAFVFPKPCQY